MTFSQREREIRTQSFNTGILERMGLECLRYSPEIFKDLIESTPRQS